MCPTKPQKDLKSNEVSLETYQGWISGDELVEDDSHVKLHLTPYALRLTIGEQRYVYPPKAELFAVGGPYALCALRQ